MVRTLCLLLFLPVVVCAQLSGPETTPSPDRDYIVQQYNGDNGLPQSSVRDLLFDRNHFLWIATENGLVRFDGLRFRLYNTENTPVLRMNRFVILSRNRQAEVLIRSEFDHSVIFKVRPDYQIDVDTPATHLPYKLISFHSNGVFDLSSLHSGTTAPALDTLLQSPYYWIIDENEAVIRSSDDWCFLSRNPARIVHLPVPPAHGQPRLAFFKKDVFGILGPGANQFFRHGEPANIVVDTSLKPLLDGIAGPTPNAVSVYTKGDLVVARLGTDVYTLRLDGDTLKAGLLFRDLDFLQNLSFYAFQYDSSSGKLFIGTLNQGLYIVSPREFHLLDFPVKDYPSNIFMAGQPLPGDRLLTTNGIFDLAHRQKDVVFAAANRPDRHCLFQSSDGRIWMSQQKRLYVYDSNFTHPDLLVPFPLDSYVSDIRETSDGAIWISSLFSIWRYKDGILHPVLGSVPAFMRHNIETIAEVTPGTLWIGTWDGIYLLNMHTGQLMPQPVLPHVYARTIFRAADGSIWIGTYGNGYFKYVDGRFVALPEDAHKYLSTAHAFLEDSLGFFWISTNHGLFRIRKRELDSSAAGSGGAVFFEYFDKTFGFNTNEFNGGCDPAAFKDRQGRFYFPSLDGLVYFKPDSVRRELPATCLLIDGLSVDAVPFDRKHSTVSADFNMIAANVSAPYYGPGDNLRLEYIIGPIGEKWYPIGSDGKIVINRLPYGHYTLRVRDRLGADVLASTAVDFEVLPRWYNTRLFFVFLLAGFFGLALVLYKLRTRFLIRQNMRLQQAVEERTMELEESSLVKEKLVSVIMHDLRSPLFSMSLLLDHVAKHHREMTASELDGVLTQVGDANKDLCRFSNDFLTWYNAQKEGFVVRNELFELDVFIRETAGLYHDIARRKGLTMEEHIPAGIFLYTDKNILAVVIRNLLDNAIKYTRSGGVRIEAGKTNEAVVIHIRDTGIGMTPEKIARVLSEAGTVEGSSGFGYRFIIELLQRLNGQLHIEGTPGKGSDITLSFSL